MKRNIKFKLNNFINFCSLLIVLIAVSNTILAKDYTPYYFEAGLGANINVYTSDFTQLKGYPNCCNKFDNAFGLSYYLYAGLSRNIYLINGRTKLGANIELNNFSAKYSINEYIGNDVLEGTYRKIYVDNNLNVNWLIAGISPYINFSFFENIPLDIKFGFNLGLPISKTFTQQEVLVEPSDLYFKNGSKLNYDYAGDLPNASSLYLGAIVGAKYKVENVSGFDIYPEVSFIYGLTSPVKDLAWNNIAVRAGISVSYNIPEKDEVRLIPPPSILPEEPPLPETPDAPIVSIKVMDNQQTYKNNDTITAVFKVDYYNYVLSYLPNLFYAQNGLTPLSSLQIVEENSDINFFEIIRKSNFSDNYADIISEYTKKNNLKINIIAQSPDDSEQVLSARLNEVKNKLIQAGIDSQNIKTEIKSIVKINDDRKQIANDQRKITFKFSNKANLINSTIIKDKIDYRFNKSLAYVPEVKTEFDKFDFNSYSQFNGGDKNKMDFKMNDILLSASLFESNNNSANILKIYAEATDSLGQKGSKEFKLYLNNIKEVNNKYFNITDNDNSALILGYFNFDSYSFSAIDNNVLEYIKNKLKSNDYLIEIVPSTDNLGTAEYNRNLAEKRAKSTLGLLGFKNEKLPEHLSISYPNAEIFSNETPYGRYLNRSVIIKIKKK